MSKYLCLPCGYIYDDDNQESQNKTPFEEMPFSYRCPDCGSLKDDFEVIKEENA